ncbi:endonuclease/exonuclease/phosphatase family protein [Ferruginibacter yonginensis]|uniref:Endonuclease/exonuclease/phosphatase family protein n=1 Tax=Ferruginibacter yonginensis TaxID=1310416 RepID=A0ABV8QPH0_9BACT
MRISKLCGALLIIILFQLHITDVMAQNVVKVMSYNIRLDVKSDGENWWEVRKNKVADLMNYYEADFIGAQEVQYHQLQYLQSQMPQYQYIGVGRDDGKNEGEFSCIFYKAAQYKLLKQGTFWLSATPDSVSRGWDAACNRVCTFGLFQHKKSKQKLWVFNTHLDHVGTIARLNSVKLIADKINELTKKENVQVLITGDFNSKPTEPPYQYFASSFINTRNACKTPYGGADTWNSFAFDKLPNGCIDYIFMKQNAAVVKFATITDSYEKKYPSDHFPVLATIAL